MKRLNNYQRLTAKTDELCQKIYSAYQEHIACKKGCCGCCRHISVFAVEAKALLLALSQIPEELLIRLRQKVAKNPEPEICPLLEDGACAVYDSRPVICRTHGLPILVVQEGRHEVDFCPLNFTNLSSLPSDAFIDIEQLNQILFAINNLFISQSHDMAAQERFTISEIIAM